MILYESRDKDIRIIITARINPNGDLVVDGHDLGPRVKRLQGDYDYEYAFTIKAKDKGTMMRYLQNQGKQVYSDQELLQWLKENYGHNHGFSELMNFCKEIDVPFESFFWA
jgi:hypothetical protein